VDSQHAEINTEYEAKKPEQNGRVGKLGVLGKNATIILEMRDT